MSESKTKTQQKKVVFILVSSLISTIVLIALYMTYVTASGKKTPFFARDIDTASYDCEDKIRSRFNEDLINMQFDQISSRFEPERKQYIIYYRVSTKEEDHGAPIISDKLVKCTIWESVGYVSDFEVYRL